MQLGIKGIMKYSEVWKLLKAAGWKQIRGRKHDPAVKYENPGHLIPVPGHKDEVPSGTAHSMRGLEEYLHIEDSRPGK